MPRIDVAIPATNAGKCQAGSCAFGQAIAPSKHTLSIETR